MKYEDFFTFESIPCFSDEAPLVTIYCLTYNHGQFIEDALRGFVEQRTNYTFEVVLFDDASTDGTSDVVRRYSKKYPNIFKAFIAKENTYKNPLRKEAMKDFFQKNIRGKYLAFCEGDDCWIDSNKLQIQVNYLENNPNYVLTVHNDLLIDYSNKNRINVFNETSGDRELTISDVIQHKLRLATSSIVLRSEGLFMDEIFDEIGASDWAILLYNATKGKIYFFDRVMSIYRYRTAGSWSYKKSKDDSFDLQYQIKILHFLGEYNKYTKYAFEKDLIEKAENFISISPTK